MQEIQRIQESSIIHSDKQSILAIVDNYIEDIAHNGGDVLKDWITVEKYNVLINKMKEALKPYVLNEVSKEDYSQKEMLNCELKVVNSASKYDYTDNEAWMKQKLIVDQETIKLKEIEDFIKSINRPTTIVDPETGETIEYKPAVRYSSETIRTIVK